jgi:hypothetical protein
MPLISGLSVPSELVTPPPGPCTRTRGGSHANSESRQPRRGATKTAMGASVRPPSVFGLGPRCGIRHSHESRRRRPGRGGPGRSEECRAGYPATTTAKEVVDDDGRAAGLRGSPPLAAGVNPDGPVHARRPGHGADPGVAAWLRTTGAKSSAAAGSGQR